MRLTRCKTCAEGDLSSDDDFAPQTKKSAKNKMKIEESVGKKSQPPGDAIPKRCSINLGNHTLVGFTAGHVHF